MHPISVWRALPPAGAPLSLAGISRALAAQRDGETALEALKQSVRRMFAIPHVFLHASGREALVALFRALRALRPERDQVLLPAYCSFSLPSAVVKAGCRVGLYDLDPDTLLPRTDSLRAALGQRCLAVVACHQFGFAFDLAPLETLCREAGTILIDDAAQALGAVAGGRQAGTMGDAGIFSLSRGKNITAIAGGISVTRDTVLAKALAEAEAREPASGADSETFLKRLRQLAPLLAKSLALCALRHPALYRIPASLPWLRLGASVYDPHFSEDRLTPFQAGLATFSLERLETLTSARAEKATLYQSLLREHCSARCVRPQDGSTPAWLRFPLLPDKDAPDGWAQRMASRSLGVSPGFPLALHEIPDLAPHLDSNGAACPGAVFLARNLVTLPTHDHVRPEDCRAIADHVRTQAARLESPFVSPAQANGAMPKENAQP